MNVDDLGRCPQYHQIVAEHSSQLCFDPIKKRRLFLFFRAFFPMLHITIDADFQERAKMDGGIGCFVGQVAASVLVAVCVGRVNQIVHI